jgi:hypothetical protein
MGDALLALRLEPVEEQAEVDRPAGRADPARVLLQAGQVVLVQRLGVVQETADERRLAVVDAATGQEAQEIGPLVADEQVGDGAGLAQK